MLVSGNFAPSSLLARSHNQLFKGTIGKLPIFLELSDRYDTSVSGRYFYVSKLRDIEFSGTITKETYQLDVSQWSNEARDEEVIESFQLHQSKNGELVGTWRSGKKKLAVSLKTFDIATINHPYERLPEIQEMKTSRPYEYARMSFVRLVGDSSTMKGSRKLHWYHAAPSDVAFFLRTSAG